MHPKVKVILVVRQKTTKMKNKGKKAIDEIEQNRWYVVEYEVGNFKEKSNEV